MTENFNLDKFEPLFIKGIISDPAVIATTNSFLKGTKKLFKNQDFAILVGFYRYFFEKRERIPTIDEIRLFVKDESMLNSITNSIEKVKDIDFDNCDKELFYLSAERFVKERLIWGAMVDIASKMEKSGVDSAEVLSTFESICSITFNTESGTDLYEDLDKVIQSLNDKRIVISTGYKSVDDNIDGGLYADGRALYMFMGPPNKGKSLFLGNVACNIANQGKTALVISLEMSEMAYAARFCAQQSSVAFSELHLRTSEVKEKLLSKPGKIIIKEFPPSSVTVPQLKNWIKKHIIEKGIKIDAIIIDYLNLFDGPGNNMYEKIKAIAEQVRALSYVFSVPCISATQQNRTASGKEMAGLNSVSESSGIAMTADVILEIFQNEEDVVGNYYRLGFAKNRYGPVNFSVITKINYETLRIEDLNESGIYTTEIGSSIESSLDNFIFES